MRRGRLLAQEWFTRHMIKKTGPGSKFTIVLRLEWGSRWILLSRISLAYCVPSVTSSSLHDGPRPGRYPNYYCLAWPVSPLFHWKATVEWSPWGVLTNSFEIQKQGVNASIWIFNPCFRKLSGVINRILTVWHAVTSILCSRKLCVSCNISIMYRTSTSWG